MGISLVSFFWYDETKEFTLLNVQFSEELVPRSLFHIGHGRNFGWSFELLFFKILEV